MKNRCYFVYIMASLSGTLYIGVTNSVRVRSGQHQMGSGSAFTSRYGCNRLVYFDSFRYVGNAIAREKELKGWRRSKKVALIKTMNPGWRDLSRDFGKEFTPDHLLGNTDSSLRSE